MHIIRLYLVKLNQFNSLIEGGGGLGLFSTYRGVVWLDWVSSSPEVSESSDVRVVAKVSLAGVSVVLVALRYAMLRSSYKLPSGFVGSGPPSISAMASTRWALSWKLELFVVARV